MSTSINELVLGRYRLDLSDCQVMGVLNVTPDSFSDGGRFASRDAALQQAESMCRAGAAIIDVGGESTRPGAEPVSVQQELDRVIPVVESLTGTLDVPVSVDTSTPEVMQEAVSAGAVLINDVRALRRPGALEAAASLEVPVCLMHMQGEPESMQASPCYGDVVAEVMAFLRERIEVAGKQGISRSRLIVDPGFGFGKTLAHNYQLLAALQEFRSLGLPVLVGMSRKSMIGHVLDKPVSSRLSGSLAAAVIAALKGAQIVRVHDVAETADALAIVRAMNELGQKTAES